MPKHHCSRCQKLVATSTRNPKRAPRVHNGATLLARAHEAPRVRCVCGLVMILLRGEA